MVAKPPGQNHSRSLLVNLEGMHKTISSVCDELRVPDGEWV